MSISGEVWRTVPSVDSVLVSSEGRVMLAPRRETLANGEERISGGVPLLGWWDRQQARFLVSVNGRNYKVARLICEAFNGPPPFEGALALHENENAADNRASNIRWGTQVENLNMPNFIAYCESRTGADNPRVKSRRQQEAEWRAQHGDMFAMTESST